MFFELPEVVRVEVVPAVKLPPFFFAGLRIENHHCLRWKAEGSEGQSHTSVPSGVAKEGGLPDGNTGMLRHPPKQDVTLAVVVVEPEIQLLLKLLLLHHRLVLSGTPFEMAIGSLLDTRVCTSAMLIVVPFFTKVPFSCIRGKMSRISF